MFATCAGFCGQRQSKPYAQTFTIQLDEREACFSMTLPGPGVRLFEDAFDH